MLTLILGRKGRFGVNKKLANGFPDPEIPNIDGFKK